MKLEQKDVLDAIYNKAKAKYYSSCTAVDMRKKYLRSLGADISLAKRTVAACSRGNLSCRIAYTALRELQGKVRECAQVLETLKVMKMDCNSKYYALKQVVNDFPEEEQKKVKKDEH
jgi:hypothetical protein